MKYLIAIGMCLGLLVGGVFHDTPASMYWDFETPDLETMGEPEATPRDSMPVQRPGRQTAPKMYDDYEVPEIGPMSVDQPAATAPLRSSEDSVSAPVARPQTPRRTQQSGPPDTSIQTISPRPAITQPGSQSVSTPSAEKPTQVSPAGTSAAPPANQTKDQQPLTKKMKWGKPETESNQKRP